MGGLKTAKAVIETIRPHQWVKNAFVLAPVVFAQQLLVPGSALRGLAAMATFCALSGAVYAFNDVRDVASDRDDPVKCMRPIARGALSERSGITLALCLALIALPAAYLISPWLCVVSAMYLANNLAYSLYLKQVAFVDVIVIATGFLLRVLAGAFAVDVPVSVWLLGCTGLLASLLGFGKRAHELSQLQSRGGTRATSRGSLRGYSIPTLRAALTVLAAATTTAYAFYTMDAHTVDAFGGAELVITAPFCAFGIFRFLQLALWKPKLESPTEAMLKDPLFLANILVWAAVVVVVIYR